MPTISRFYGISIQMFHKEHGVPHSTPCTRESEHRSQSTSWGVLEGSLPRRAERLVREWAAEHRDELLSNWELARAGKAPARIEPLR